MGEPNKLSSLSPPIPTKSYTILKIKKKEKEMHHFFYG